MISKITKFLAYTLGKVLVYLRPKKAKELSKDRITLLYKNKKHMTLQERLMKYVLVKNLKEIEDHEAIAESNRNFWENKQATDLFVETADMFEKLFLPHCTFIFDLLEKEMQTSGHHYTTLVEIGTGNGNVLNFLSERFATIEKFVGIDLSHDQIELNKNTFNSNPKLEFVAQDVTEWAKQHGHNNIIFVSNNGVLEYFKEDDLQHFLKDIYALGGSLFVAIEPNGKNHDFDKNPGTQLYGKEPSFSHNYPKLFKNAGFSLWHFSQKPWPESSVKMTFIGAKS